MKVCRLFLAAAVLGAAQVPLDQIRQNLTARALEADVSFLASDELEGRATPSRGLGIAAEYIASQFRGIGLEPAGGDGYFQVGEADVSPTETVKLRNVVGILRGADASLRDTFVLFSAHYDHLGKDQQGRIYNGANDDASGVATLIETARALAALPARPRRSIVFVAFAGEERRLLGSRYYVAHPVEPLTSTVADINLEQLGRTDAPEGPHLLMFNVTGFDFTTITESLRKAAEAAGIQVVNDARNSDGYYVESDNLPFAEAGIPSHTISVTYEFPDYHEPGDQWPKLDYVNMAKVDGAIALGLLEIANSTAPPSWNSNNPKAVRYAKP